MELTGLIDVATRTVPAAVIRPTAKSVDASVLLARALTPEPMRPGLAGGALAMAHSALPYDRLLGIDERLRYAAARPVIVPDTIVIDYADPPLRRKALGIACAEAVSRSKIVGIISGCSG